LLIEAPIDSRNAVLSDLLKSSNDNQRMQNYEQMLAELLI
jgi:hypothetical protein